ncbi:MAG TPA: cytochrome c-type biogenesis protein CcmH [Candidatus Angelobacter sp.]|nr:cytochrome c-type biogenesis protein CcmH [Candidatus Angelobacter sp.]
MKRLLRILLVPCVILVLMGADNQEARFQSLGGKIMCTCSCTQMLLKCNHVGCPNSDRMIRELRANVQSTSNDQEVLDWFRKTWGVTAVVEPSTHGFELFAWILPPLGLGLGLLLVIFVIRSWKLRTAPIAPADLNLDQQLESLRARAHRETEI